MAILVFGNLDTFISTIVAMDNTAMHSPSLDLGGMSTMVILTTNNLYVDPYQRKYKKEYSCCQR